MTGEPVTIWKAAREFGRSEHTIREWIRRGAPVVREGKPGRGNGALVDLSALRAWRDRQKNGDVAYQVAAREFYKLCEIMALETLQRECTTVGGKPVTAHQRLGIPESRAAAFLLMFLDRTARKLFGKPPEVSDTTLRIARIADPRYAETVIRD